MSVMLVALTGCPGSGGSSSGDGDTCAGYFNALASYANRCEGSSSATLESSRSRFQDLCNKALAAPGATNLASTLSSCTAQVNTATCGANDLDCDTAPGAFADGTPCGESYQCQSAFCKRPSDTLCGTCAPRIPIGGDCASGSSSECVEGARCVSSTTGSGTGTTTTQKCVAIKIAKAGEACSSKSGEAIECDKGLSCFFSQSGSTPSNAAVCRAPAGTGGDCFTRSDCTSGLVCTKNKCSAPLGEGAACSGSECAQGLACDEKVCKTIVFVKGGEACGGARRCERGSCRGQSVQTTPGGGTTVTPGKCIDPLPDGAACKTGGSSSSAEPQASCDTFARCIAGTCQVPDPSQCK